MKVKTKVKYKYFRPATLSRHPTHAVLRSELPLMPFRSCIRLGSTTNLPDTVSNGGDRIEINTIQAVKNSANKLLMKECFTQAGVKTADWWTIYESNGECHFTNQYSDKGTNCKFEDLPYPIIVKHIYGSRGSGNHKIDSIEQFKNWIQGKDIKNYICEKFYNFSREYRLHITQNGCFYTCRKMLKADTVEANRWFRNDSNCVWYTSDNPGFDKPTNWNVIEQECIKALKSVGLDIGGFDLRVQSTKDKDGNTRQNPDFLVIESNSACSFAEITAKKYIEILPSLLTQKFNNK
jgi:D-alanine-D-alanine ligase-like ATP-grasp enzyme